MKIKLKGFIVITLLFAGTYLFAQNTAAGTNGLSRGESLFKENNAKDAVQVLEYEILNGQISENSYNFLGLGYYQLGEFDKSIDAFKRGLKVQPDNKKLLSYNLGNTYYAMKEYTLAAGCYSDSLNADPLFYDALLNRANALLMAGQLVSSKEDYSDFIKKCPDDSQKERIELLITALEEEIARREEEARLLAEQNKALWEEYDGNLADRKNEAFTPDWEQIEKELYDSKKNGENPDWERIERELAEARKNGELPEWEVFEHESDSLARVSEKVSEEVVTDDVEDWYTFSDDELDEMKELEKQSREEHEKWLESERKRTLELEKLEALAREKQQQNAIEEERKLREQLIEDMKKADDERRKKLLEDVANSLQGSDSTNLTSGAEDLIEYDLEGELD